MKFKTRMCFIFLVFIIALAVFIVVYLGYFFVPAVNFRPVMPLDNYDIGHDRILTYDFKAYDVLLHGYARGGSSFTGNLLSLRKDAFYWFEPIYNYGGDMNRWEICRWTKCRTWMGIYDFMKIEAERNMKAGQTVLRQIYTCYIRSVFSDISEDTPAKSGESWNTYQTCRNQYRSKAVCAKRMERVCRQSKHRVSKIIRLLLDNLEVILAKNPQVKIIHLFRDPRAIVNSRLMASSWYFIHPVHYDIKYTIRAHANFLCEKMLYNFHSGLHMKRKYPDRFAFVFYEDLINNTVIKAQNLFSYFGMDTITDVSVQEMLTSLSRKSPKQYTNGWQQQLSRDVIDIIDDQCSYTYKALGYMKMPDAQILNPSLAATFKFREEFLIENIDKVSNYYPLVWKS